jgi:hypothetical protein
MGQNNTGQKNGSSSNLKAMLSVPQEQQQIQRTNSAHPVQRQPSSHEFVPGKVMPTVEEVKAKCGDHMIFSDDMKAVKLDDFELLKVIGKGQFAKVFSFFFSIILKIRWFKFAKKTLARFMP